MLSVSVSHAASKYFTFNGLNYKVLSWEDHTVEVDENRRATNDIIIPSSVIYDNDNYTVTSIGEDVFSRCPITSVSIPNTVTKIGGYAFSNCTSLTSISIPNSVTEIDEYAFRECTKLTSISLPNTLTTIAKGVFYECSSLSSVVIPITVTSISEDAFNFCSTLTSISISNTVTEIGNYAFSNCESLTSVSIPNSVTKIGYNAFSYCPNLTSVYYVADEPIEGYSNIFNEEIYQSATLYMTKKGIEIGKTIAPWKNFKNIKVYDPAGIDEITADIDENTPYEIYNLNGVKISDSIDSLASGIYIVRQDNKTKKIAVK